MDKRITKGIQIVSEFGLVSLGVLLLTELVKPGLVTVRIDLIWYSGLILVLVLINHLVRSS